MKFGFAFLYVIGIIVVMIVYIIGLYPFLQDVINAAMPTLDLTSAAVIGFLPMVVLLMLLIHLLRHGGEQSAFH